MSDASSVPTDNAPAHASVSSQPRFTLAELMLWMTGLSVAMAVIYWLGWFGFVVVLVGAITYIPYRLEFSGLFESSAAAIAIGSIAAMLIPFDNGSREAARRTQCAANLKQLALALQSYHDTHGTFPPAYIADADGKPMHSWRVLILPFIEQEQLYKQYRFDEPWDGPNNVKLHAQMPRVFGCPSERSSHTGMTSYLAVVGPQTIWPGERAASLRDVIDDASTTLLLAESHASGIHWLEPRDLHLGQMAPTVNSDRGQGISGLHFGRSGAWAVYVDGGINYLDNDLSAQQLRGMLTIDGGETVLIP